jgi:hypothetical protein
MASQEASEKEMDGKVGGGLNGRGKAEKMAER